jgi:cytoskeletal protein CcmA (bactofilin family)/ribosomal protein S27E
VTAGRQQSSANKAQVLCPHCGATQVESVYAKTTICRSCGRGFKIRAGASKPVAPAPKAARPGAKTPGAAAVRAPGGPAAKRRAGHPPAPAAPPAPEAAVPAAPSESAPKTAVTDPPGWADRFKALFVRRKEREILCFRCGTSQVISTQAKSASCRHCGSYIDIRDLKISANYNRVIETQGMIEITRTGELTSPRAVCGEAVIRGPFQGTFICTGTARIRWKGRLVGALETKELVIERGADTELARTVRADRVEVCGRLSARIDAGVVTVRKKGILEGSVRAKAFVVDKGGFFTGELAIGQQDLSQPDLLAADAPASSARQPAPGGSGSLSPVV